MPLFARIARRAVLPILLLSVAALIAPVQAAAQCLLCSDSAPAADAITTETERELPLNVDITADLDFSAAEASLGDGIAAARRHAEAARERARQLAQQTTPAPASTAAATAAAAALPTCPACHAVVAADDVFCGNCAHKLG